MEWQLRNWLYFTWLSGDHIVEQHVHNLDVVNWALGAHPVRAVGMGGRQVRTGPDYGHIFDHFAVDYEYPNGVHVLSMCRQQAGTPGPRLRASSAPRDLRQPTDGVRFAIKGRQRLEVDGEYTNPYVCRSTST